MQIKENILTGGHISKSNENTKGAAKHEQS